jgi:hypothetical protein
VRRGLLAASNGSVSKADLVSCRFFHNDYTDGTFVFEEVANSGSIVGTKLVSPLFARTTRTPRWLLHAASHTAQPQAPHRRHSHALRVRLQGGLQPLYPALLRFEDSPLRVKDCYLPESRQNEYADAQSQREHHHGAAAPTGQV